MTIYQITNDILDKFIATKSYLAVVFFKEDHQKSTDALLVLEEIDDDLDELDVLLVKINEATVASDFGIEDRPCLVIFEKGQ